MTIQQIIDVLEVSERIGQAEDVPEGARYIQISETLTSRMIEGLKKYNESLN